MEDYKKGDIIYWNGDEPAIIRIKSEDHDSEYGFVRPGVPPYLVLHKSYVRAATELESSCLSDRDFMTKNEYEKKLKESVDKKKQSKKTPQEEVLSLLGRAFNAFNKIPGSEKHPSDNVEFTTAIHAAQNILYTQLYIKEHGKVNI